MKLTPWIAWRYLFSRKAGQFGPLLTVVAMTSIAIGMLSLIVVMSVMQGFKIDLSDRLLGFNAHITLTKTQDEASSLSAKNVRSLLKGVSVRDIAPLVQGEVIAKSISTGELLAQGARVRGIDANMLGAAKGLKFRFPEWRSSVQEAIETDDETGLPGAIIGSEIVLQMAVHPSFHDSIELIAPLADVGPTGELLPGKKRFAVSGIFKAGIFDYDAKYILTSVNEAKKLLGQQAEEGWQIRLTDATSVAPVLKEINSRLPEGWKAAGWNDQNKKLFAALKLERIAMTAILVMVLLIASFAIAGVIFLITAAKRKDIAILESIGMKRKDVMLVFLFNALFIGAAGSLIGFIGGLSISHIIRIWPIKLPSSYYLDYLPVDFNPVTAIAFSIIGIIIAIAASIYPVRQAMKTNVVDVLRYE